MAKKKKQKVETINMVNFILTKTDEKVKIENKNYDWDISFSNQTDVYHILISFLKFNTKEELSNIITMLYYITNTLFTDLDFTESVATYFKVKLEESQNKLKEITKKRENEHLKAVKDIDNLKGNE